MMNEMISIIIPVYNTDKYIERCVRSAMDQTYKNLEIIIVDDGSTDQSGIICDKLAENDERIIVCHQKNQGLVKSRKVGLENAHGRYVGFLDSDDWIDYGMYEYLIRQAVNYNAEIVTSEHYIESEDGVLPYIGGAFKAGVYSPKESEYFCENMIYDEKFNLWGISPNFWNKLFLKEHLMKFEKEIDERITYGEDDACVYPCMAFADKVVVTKERFYHYWRRKDAMSVSADDSYYMRINYMYLSFKRNIVMHPLWQIIKKRFDLYMFEFVSRGVEGLWGITPIPLYPKRVFDFSILGEGFEKKFVLYGAGKVGRNCYSQLRMVGMTNSCIWVDNNYENLQKMGLPVVSPDSLRLTEFHVVLVAVLREGLYEKIKEQLIEFGIDEKLITWVQTKKTYELMGESWS